MQSSQILAAIDCARDLISSFQLAPGPVDVIALARKQGVSAVEPAEMSADGYLARTRDGALVIRYRATNNRSRNRFTIAHEIAHLIFAQVQGQDLDQPRIGRLGSANDVESCRTGKLSTHCAKRIKSRLPQWRLECLSCLRCVPSQ